MILRGQTQQLCEQNMEHLQLHARNCHQNVTKRCGWVILEKRLSCVKISQYLILLLSQ